MLFSGTSLGIEIFQNGIAMVLAKGQKTSPVLERHEIVRMPGDLIKPSLKDSNVIEPPVLKSVLSDAYLRLLTNAKRVSLSIPDSSGRVLLLDVESNLKNKEEGIDHVKWKLKKTFPVDLNDVHLDYQVLRQADNGSCHVLVGIVSRAVINEYEEILLELGLEPYLIDFSSFNLYRLFAPRLEIHEHLTFVSLYRGSLSVLIFQDGCLEFTRNKFLSTSSIEPTRLFREVNSSLVVYSDSKGGWKPRNVYYYATGEEGELLKKVLLEAVSGEPVHVDTSAFAGSSRQQIDRGTLPDLLSALGAATRGLR